MPEGIAAALAVSPHGPAEPNAAAATRAAARCHTIEVARAVRETEINGVSVAEGSWIAVLDGKLITGRSSLDSLLEHALDALAPDPYEVATVYVGADGDDEGATAIRDVIARQTGMSVETQQGGQPHYAYIISLE
jgi:dihydroxyacetone kinase-like predicted kinase